MLLRTAWDQHGGTDRYGDVSHQYATENPAMFLVQARAQLVGIESVNIDDAGFPSLPEVAVTVRNGSVCRARHRNGAANARR